MNYKNMVKSKIAIAAIAKNENLYIRDWVEYHKNLGIDKIFLYDNNDKNGEHFEDVIKDYIDSKYVVIINKRGIEKGLVYDKNNINLLNQCYIDTYNDLKDNYNDFKWVFFIDIDEYINIKKGTLKECLNSKKYNNYDTICFPWIIYNDNNKLTWKSGSLQKRFTTKSDKQVLNAASIKSCIRIGKEIDNYNQYMILHYLLLKGKHICYETGKPIKMVEIEAILNNNTPEKVEKVDLTGFDLDCNITINHYKFKTLEEYLIRLFKRHWGTTKNMTNKISSVDNLAHSFFNYNEKTPEKEQIFYNLKDIIKHGKVIVNIFYKNDKQVINILKQLNKQVFHPTDILIHITEEQSKKSKLNLKNYKFKNIRFYYDITKPKYSENTLIKENDLKYKIILNDTTKYDDQYLKTLIIKSLFK